MTISNKYDVRFSVLTIKVVGCTHVNWITKKMVKNVLSINSRERIVVKSRSIYANDCVSCIHGPGVEHAQRRRIESGVANRV
jgi:hypothetical protein